MNKGVKADMMADELPFRSSSFTSSYIWCPCVYYVFTIIIYP